MKSCMPEAYKELVENCEILERHYKDMVDIEFTVQEYRLWMLQCRSGQRTGKGAVKIVVDMVNEGLVDTHTAIKMFEPQHLNELLHPQFEDPSAYKDKVVAKGLPASPGAAVGQVVFSADDAEEWHAQEKSVILGKVNYWGDREGRASSKGAHVFCRQEIAEYYNGSRAYSFA